MFAQCVVVGPRLSDFVLESIHARPCLDIAEKPRLNHLRLCIYVTHFTGGGELAESVPVTGVTFVSRQFLAHILFLNLSAAPRKTSFGKTSRVVARDVSGMILLWNSFLASNH